MSRPAFIEKLFQPAKWIFKKELIPMDDLAGPGLKVVEKKLNVDFSSMPPDQMRNIVLAMVRSGGGLVADSATGKIYFDPESMDTAVFDKMLKALRLQKWLTANTQFYVNKSHAQAADTLDEGRGLSADKPFKTIQACVNYVASNYNMQSYKAAIHVAAGDYSGDVRILVLPSFSYTSGAVHIIGGGRTDTILPRVSCDAPSPWTLQNCTCKAVKPAQGEQVEIFGIRSRQGYIENLINVGIDLSDMDGLSGTLYAIMVDGGMIQVYATNNTDPNGLYLKAGSRQVTTILFVTGNGAAFNMTADINLLSDITCGTFINSWNKGSFKLFSSALSNPGRDARINLGDHTVTGKRYNAGEGGTIATSKGPSFFPGSIEGTVSSSTCSWYY